MSNPTITSVKLIITLLFMLLLPQNLISQQNLNTDMFSFKIGKQHYLFSKVNPYAAYVICEPDWYCSHQYAAYDWSLIESLNRGISELIDNLDKSFTNENLSNAVKETLNDIDQTIKSIEDEDMPHDNIMSEQEFINYINGFPLIIENIQETKRQIEYFLENEATVYGEKWNVSEWNANDNSNDEFASYIPYILDSTQASVNGLNLYSWNTEVWDSFMNVPSLLSIKSDLRQLTSMCSGRYFSSNIISYYQARIENFSKEFERLENNYTQSKSNNNLTQSEWITYMRAACSTYKQLIRYDSYIKMEYDYVTEYVKQPQSISSECGKVLNYLKDFVINYIHNCQKYRNELAEIESNLKSFHGDFVSLLQNQNNTFNLPLNVIDEDGNCYEVRRIMRGIPHSLDYENYITVEIPANINAIIRPENSADVIFGYKYISKIISHNNEPPILGDEYKWDGELHFADFPSSTRKETLLIVPDGSVEKYNDQKTLWHYFFNIESLSEVVETPDDSNGIIYEVYSIDGYRIAEIVDKSDIGNMIPGVYILKHGTEARLHIVK